MVGGNILNSISVGGKLFERSEAWAVGHTAWPLLTLPC